MMDVPSLMLAPPVWPACAACGKAAPASSVAPASLRKRRRSGVGRVAPRTPSLVGEVCGARGVTRPTGIGSVWFFFILFFFWLAWQVKVARSSYSFAGRVTRPERPDAPGFGTDEFLIVTHPLQSTRALHAKSAKDAKGLEVFARRSKSPNGERRFG